jgi:hypothetical protein
MSEFRDFVDLTDAEVIAESPKAILVKIGDEEQFWIPQSQIDDRSEVRRRGDKGTLMISEWIWEQKLKEREERAKEEEESLF